MYINGDKQGNVATFGKVSVEFFRNSYRLRFRIGGERKVLTLRRISEASFKVACAKAQQIDLDILRVTSMLRWLNTTRNVHRPLK